MFDSNLAEEPMIYSVIDGQAMTIGEMKEGQTIPVGLAGVSGETTIEIRGIDSFTSPLYLVDALMGETTLLTSDMTLTQSGNGVRYYLASKQTIKKEDAALSVPVIMTNRCHLTVKAPADASIENIQIFSTGGICVADKTNAGVQYDTELVAGIYIVRLACSGQEYQYKIVLH